jgi:hypothetical protein
MPLLHILYVLCRFTSSSQILAVTAQTQVLEHKTEKEMGAFGILSWFNQPLNGSSRESMR